MKKSFLSTLMLICLSIYTMSAKAETLTVTANSKSGISNANCTGTLADGTTLGFYYYSSYAYFCGAISSAEAVEVPETIYYNNKEYIVEICGRYSNENLDMDDASSVTSLTLPSTITKINSVASTVTDLHLKSTNPPSLSNSSSIPDGTTIWVPQDAISAYTSLATNSNSYWYGKIIHYEGWVCKSVTVTVNSPGTFAQLLLNQVQQWSDVDELTVIGKLNETDLGYLSRLKNVTLLDLSQTDIESITGCGGLIFLKKVLLPSTVVDVQARAFYSCNRLREITIPNATSIGSYAFSSCTSLTTVSLPAATSIGSDAFRRCTSLTTVDLPAVISIGESAFSDCSSLTTVDLPKATDIGGSAFSYCSSLATVCLPAATSIGSDAFSDCSSLTTVSLSAATSIGYAAFRDCVSLTTVDLPAVISIGSDAFSRCTSLTTVDLPAVISIDESAFSYCSSLRNITLPTMLHFIGGDAFYKCNNLEDVYCHVISPLNTTAFKSTGASTTLHVPAFSVSAYMLHDDWYTFNKIVPLEGNLDKVNIISDFTITELKGLAEKVDLSVLSFEYGYSNYQGHLTVSVNDKWSLGEYLQTQSSEPYYDYGNYNYANTTLIPYNEMTAENVKVKYSAETNRWNFISFPFDVNVSDIQYPEGTLWVIRKYSGEDRAKMTGNTWQNMTNGMTLKAGEGYILHCTDGKTDSWNTSYIEFTFKAVNNSSKNNIFAYQNVTKPLSKYASDLAHNRNWNLVGNPYPCYFDTRNIKHNGTITIWNGNGYTAYSLLDDNYVLRPHESFFVQCPADATSMTFMAEGRQHTYEASSDASRAKVARVTDANLRQVFNITLSGTAYTDKVRVVINESAKLDYEISCDASKFMSNNTAVPQIYIIENGQKMAIDERPLSDGTIALGMYIGEAGDYTIGMSSASAEDILLVDNATGEIINLCNQTYTFSSSKGTCDNRFTIQIGDATGIMDIPACETKKSDIYNISGQKLSAPQKGINIINGNKILTK